MTRFNCYYSGGELQAVRNDRFKLVFPHRYRTIKGHAGGFGGRPIPYQQDKIDRLTLYDLDNDISEKKKRHCGSSRGRQRTASGCRKSSTRPG